MRVETRVLSLRVYKNCCPIILSWVSLKKVLVAVTYRLSSGAYVFRIKPKDETNIRNRYVAETQTDKR
jgi:hypothetical protein